MHSDNIKIEINNKNEANLAPVEIILYVQQVRFTWRKYMSN